MGLDMYLDGVKFHSAYGKDENGNTIKVGRPKCKDGHEIKRSVIDLALEKAPRSTWLYCRKVCRW